MSDPALTRELLDPSWLAEYDSLLDTLWYEAVRVTENLIVLDRIAAFPFRELGVSWTPFWRLTFFALYDATVIALYKIIVDKRPEVLTLPRLEREILEHIPEMKHRLALQSALQSHQIDDTTKKALSLVRKLRNSKIGHLNRDIALGAVELGDRRITVPFGELRKVIAIVQRLILVLSLGHGRSFHTLPYSPLVTRPEGVMPLDIDILLDSVASRSSILHLPETMPDSWATHREYLQTEALTQISKYRKRLGLPEIWPR